MEKTAVTMNLTEIYDLLCSNTGTPVIKEKAEKYTVCTEGMNCSQRIKMNRLFISVNAEETNEDDINKIMTSGLVRSKYKGTHYAEDMMRSMLLDDLKSEAAYLEACINDSIVFSVGNEMGQNAAEISGYELTETQMAAVREFVLPKYRQACKDRYEVFKNKLLEYVSTKNISVAGSPESGEYELSTVGFLFGESATCGEIMALLMADILSKVQIAEGIRKSTCDELKNLQEKLSDVIAHNSVNDNTDYGDRYLADVWSKNHASYMRDQDQSLLVDIISTYILPDIREGAGNTNNGPDLSAKVDYPFDGKFGRIYIRAKSGIGKSFLMKGAVISAVYKAIYAQHRELMSERETHACENGEFEKLFTYFYSGKSADRYPVYINASWFNDLSDFVTGKEAAYENILRACESFDELNELLLHEKSAPDRMIFFIDSLDELEESVEEEFNASLTSLLNKYPESVFVFTSRFSGKDVRAENFKDMHLVGFDRGSIENYISKCYFLSERNTSELKTFIKENEYAFELAQNPFMLGAMISVKDFEYSVKKSLDVIINSVIKVRFDRKRLAMTDVEIRAVLAYLAFNTVFINEQGNRLSKSLLCSTLREARDAGLISITGESAHISDEKINAFSDNLSCQSGIINVISDLGRKFFVFQDELVMCYLAAEYLNILSQTNENSIPQEYVVNIQNNRMREENIYELFRFTENVINKESSIDKRLFYVVANFLLLMCDKKSVGSTLLYFLIIKGMLSTDDDVLSAVRRCLSDFNEYKFGEAVIFRKRSEIEEVQILIERLLNM